MNKKKKIKRNKTKKIDDLNYIAYYAAALCVCDWCAQQKTRHRSTDCMHEARL